MAAKTKSKPKIEIQAEVEAAATKPMAVKSAPKKSANGTPNKITLKHLAHGLAEEHQMTKKKGEAMLNDLVALITKHLKKGERIRIVGSRHPAGAQARRPHGPQSGDRRSDQDQGEQEGCLPRGQRPEDGGLILFSPSEGRDKESDPDLRSNVLAAAQSLRAADSARAKTKAILSYGMAFALPSGLQGRPPDICRAGLAQIWI